MQLWYFVFVCHRNDICKDSIGSVYVGGYCGFAVKCVQSAFFLYLLLFSLLSLSYISQFTMGSKHFNTMSIVTSIF